MDFFFYQTTLKLYSNYLQTILFLFVKYFDSKAYNETLIIAIFFFYLFYKILVIATPCPVFGNLIGDNWFNCRLNLFQLQRWLTVPSPSRSYMTSHIMAGGSREKICISQHLNFFAFKLTN